MTNNDSDFNLEERFSDRSPSYTNLGSTVDPQTGTSKVETSAGGLPLSSLEPTGNLRQPGRATPEVQYGVDGLPLSSLESTGNLRQLGRATPQVQDGGNGLLFSVDCNQANLGMKRDLELVSGNLSVAKGRVTKKQRRGTVFIGESSTLQEQPEPKPKRKELIEEKPIQGDAKNLVDRLDRKIIKTYLSIYKMIAEKACDLLPQVFGSLEQIEAKWPLLSDLKEVKQSIRKIQRDHKEQGLPEAEAKLKLLQIRNELIKFDQQLKELNEGKDPVAMFLNQKDYDVETLQKEFYSKYPFMEEVADDHGSLPTPEELQSKYNELANEIYAKDNNKGDVQDELKCKINELENEIYAKDNNKVNFQDFPALRHITGLAPPDCLKPIAIRIDQARGKATECIKIGSQLLVCAAIKEMEDLLVKDLDKDRLKKWGAALKSAKEQDFQVEFADDLLHDRLVFFAAQQWLDATKKKGSKIISG
ncbi:hypothetical protein J1N35_024201 [Gossypium stocksii]|uniref:Uncharacterized protein n=1 Tax=Gossypium stocksii TaxID=47602 RepID=A0A9D3VJH3_9ROSI|nr:hypothetical protein J1N35_024201 [Gossypium stocksii]